MTDSNRTAAHAWKVALLAALAFVLVDSAVRLRRIDAQTAASIGPARAIATDTASPSGLEGNQHNLVLPLLGTDGYQWLMQTQQMLAHGDARIRWVDYDGPPDGRSVHWSSLLHWWAAGFAWIAGKLEGVSTARAVEHVGPWANTVFLGVLLVVLVPVVARRFGAIPAMLFAVGAVTVYPFYEFFAVGNFDHHGVASTAALLTVLLLLGGGAGWVRAAAAPDDASPGTTWFRDARSARPWFIASGIAGGAGLWISAATEIPALVGVGIAACIACGLLGRGSADAERIEPTLWRTWGIAGAASSVAFYLLEYFPAHMGVRLEVNNPLYALAWFGGGDFICRFCELTTAARTGAPRDAVPARTARARAIRWMAFDVALIAAAPAIALFAPSTFVLRPGSLVIAMHEDYIDEFQSLPRQLAHWSWTQINAGVGLLPLMLIGPAGALALGKRVARPWRAVAVLGLLPALVFTGLAFRHGRWLGIGSALWLATLVSVATIAAAQSAGVWTWSVAKRVLIGFALALPAAVVPLALSSAAVQDAGTQAPTIVAAMFAGARSVVPLLTTLFAVAVALAAVLPGIAVVRGWTSARLVLAGVALGLVFTPFPVVSAYKWISANWVYPMAPSDLQEIVTRDVSRKLRMRLGAERGIVASGPTTTTWMAYFGGFKGVGTLYWENHEGIEESARLFGAAPTSANSSAADAAYDVVKREGITHIVLFSWNAFTAEYARLALGRRVRSGLPADDEAVTDRSFGAELLRGELPVWLRPLPYRVPQMAGLEDEWVLVLEVVPGPSATEAAVHDAEFYLAMGAIDDAVRVLDGALARDPANVPALITLARVQLTDRQRGDARVTLTRLRAARGSAPDSLALEDQVALATVDMLAADTTAARAVMTRAIAHADARSIRRLPWDNTPANFIVLARQLNLMDARPDIMAFAFSLLDPATQAQLGGAARANAQR